MPTPSQSERDHSKASSPPNNGVARFSSPNRSVFALPPLLKPLLDNPFARPPLRPATPSPCHPLVQPLLGRFSWTRCRRAFLPIFCLSTCVLVGEDESEGEDGTHGDVFVGHE